MRMGPLSIAALLTGCSSGGGLTVIASPELEQALTPFVDFLDRDDAHLVIRDDPTRGGGSGIRLRAVIDLDCAECYRIEPVRRGYEVHAGDVLGAQYGLAHALELMDVRFYHPHATSWPDELVVSGDHPDLGVEHAPELSRRGIQLHTLHPIDATFDLWMPSPAGQRRSERIFDWLVKNRANHVQWVGLDDIIDSPLRHEPWAAHTRALLDAAHARGLSVGLNIQLFGAANLQQSFDLVDDPGDDEQGQIEERLSLLTDHTDFDRITLSFGEFFDAEPEAFIASVDRTYEILQAQQPGTEMGSKIHLGNDLRVSYQGEDLLFYFLAVYANPEIRPWVHSVMYFTLFEPTWGAYHHEEFDEHAALLLDRLAADEPVAYFPESAYWVAFDSPVPTYLPLYIRSRWFDLHEIRRRAQEGGFASLDDHELFSSGWEWGYWQNDYATLRMTWQIPDDYRVVLDEMFAPYGEPELAAVVGDLADRQHAALIDGPLAAWLCGRENIIELGYALGIVSQPPRVGYDEIDDLDATERSALRTSILPGLQSLASDTRALEGRLLSADVPLDDPFIAELRDGIEIDALRAEFTAATLQAVLDHADGQPASVSVAEEAFAQARVVVDRRHGSLFDPVPERLITEDDNPTVYQFGYLLRAEELCYWERELIKARNAVEGANEAVPGCSL